MRNEKHHTHSSLLRLAKMMRPHIGKLLLCVLCVLIANAAQLINPLLSAVIIDDFLYGNAVQSGLYSIMGIGCAYLVIEILGAFCSLFRVRTIFRISQSILHKMRGMVFDKIMHMPIATLDRYGTGRLITRATNDVETVNEFYSDVFLNLFHDVFLLLGILCVMLAADFRLALVAMIGVPLIALITFSIKRVIKRNFRFIKSVIGKINGFIAEHISGIRVIQGFNRQKEKYKEFDALNRDYQKGTMTQVMLNTFLRPSMEVVNNLVIALIVAYGYHRISGGFLEVGVLYAFTTYVRKFFDPINDLAEKYTTVQSAMVSVDRIYEILDEPIVEESESGGYCGPVRGDVEFRDVWFAYRGEEWVLKGLTFHLPAGASAAFVGPTGVGKSTVILLIGRYYTVQRGEILVDGIPISQWNLSALRTGISTVLQDVFLFNGTVRENIDMASGLSDEAILRALRTARADFIQGAEGLSLPVQEQGLNFSTGQRQLLSFARAIASDPGVLVLDEATAHIDSNTERELQASIAAISQGRTSIYIAHRLSTIRNCSVIYVLHDGVIAEQGTHDELIARGGRYAALIEAAEELA